MAEITCSERRKVNFKFLFALIVIAVCAIMLVTAVQEAPAVTVQHPVTSLDHAVVRHGWDAVKAQTCFETEGAIHMGRKADGRNVYICRDMESCYHIVVTVFGNEDEPYITCFPKEKLTLLEQVIQYVINSGVIEWFW